MAQEWHNEKVGQDENSVFSATLTRYSMTSYPFGIESFVVRIHSVYTGLVWNWSGYKILCERSSDKLLYT